MQIQINQFAYNNPGGGTGLSHGKFGEEFKGTAVVELDTGFWDYETGWRYRGKPVSDDLVAYMGRNANPDDQTVFFSEFELADPSQKEAIHKLIAARDHDEFKSYMARLKAEIEKQPANSAANFGTICAVITQGAVLYASALDNGGFEFDNLVDPDISAWEPWVKEEMDDWFQSPVFFQLTEENLKDIASNFK